MNSPAVADPRTGQVAPISDVNNKANLVSTWKPVESSAHGRLSKAEKDSLPVTAFAFPRARKEPMTDAAHVRDAMARFNQVGGVTNAERDLAFANLQKAAKHFEIQMQESDWYEFGS